ncbi:MAG: chemotaxis protein CheW [Pseudomonadota bacterium]
MNANDLTAPDGGTTAFLLTRIGDRRFALPADRVLEIVAAGTVTPLPFAPAWVCGLANIGGRILPLFDPALLLGVDATAGAELVLVDTQHSPCALRMTEILARIAVPSADIRHIDSGSGQVIAEFEHEGQPVLLLDPDALGKLLAADLAPAEDSGLLGALETQADGAATADGKPHLAFLAGGARYAMELTGIGEVIVPPPLTPVPGAPSLVAGIGMLRDDPLLFVSLTRLLGVENIAPAAALVLDDGDLRIGLLIDRIDGVERIAGGNIRNLDEAQGEFTGVAHDDAGRITTLTATGRLLNGERRRLLAAVAPAARRKETVALREYRSYLETVIGGERFGIPLDDVLRIVDWSAPETIDGGDSRVRGALNVDGSIVPVLDPALLRRQAGRIAEGAWVIVGDAGNPWALGVDEACRIVRIARDQIEDTGGADTLLNGIAHIDRRFLSLVSIRQATARSLS